MKKLLLLFSILIGFGLWAQDTITTLPTFTNNNGQSGVSFEVVATSAMKITGIANYFNSGVTSTTVWIKQGPINGSGSITVNAANGWSQHMTNATVSGNGTSPVYIQNFVPISVAAGSTVGIVIQGGLSYHTVPAGAQTSFVGAHATLNAGGASTGFGGTVPSLGFNPRGFLGSVVTELDLLGGCTDVFTNVTTDSVLATSAQINWTPGASNSSFWLEYGAPGFTPGTGTKITGSYPGAQPPVNLTGLSVNTNYDYYIGEICNSGADSIFAVSPYQFKTTKLCAPATNLAVTNVLATTADVSWSHAGGANSFTVYYGTGLSQTATSSPYTLTGLTSNTSYDIYVVADCGTTNGLSDSIGPVTFLTPCAITTAPFSEDFDGTAWVASGSNANNAIDQCWSSNPAITQNTEPFKWMPRSTGPTSGNGPLTDQTGTNFMYCEASGSANGDVAEFTTPIIDASGLTTPGLYFHQHRNANGGTIADMQVEVSNDLGTTWDTVYTITGETQNASGDPWLLEFVNLAQYTGDTILVKFVQLGNGCCGDAAIDNVEIKEAPTCPWPTNINVNFITSTSAVVGWTDPSGSSWDIEFGPTGFTQGTGNITTTSANPDTLTGLTPDTEYDVYVRANCVSGGNGFSIWIGPVTFRTKCAAFTAPYFNDFSNDISNTIPNCWSAIQTYGTGNFQARVLTQAGGTPYSTPNHLGIYNWTQFNATDNLAAVSPAFSDLTVGDKRINFFAKSTIAANRLLIGTTSDGVAINYVDTVTFSGNSVYQQYFIDLDSANGYNGIDNQVVFAFDLSNSTLTFDWIYIDDFTYEQIPACNPPMITSLGAIPAINSAIVYWGSGSQGDKTEVQWGTPNFMQGTGIQIGSTTVNGTVDTTTATGLMGNTQYEFWVRDSCNTSGFSPWIGPFTFFTLCAPQSAPFTENFDGSSWVATGNNNNNEINNCWSSNPDVSQNAEPFKWIPRSTGPTSGNGPLTDNTGVNFMYCEASGSSAGDVAILTSPLIDASSLIAPMLYFDQHRNSNGSSIADMSIEVSNDFGATWTNVYTVTGEIQNGSSDPWTSHFVNLPNYIGDTIAIRFIQNGNGCCGDAALDNVELKEAPFCPDPNSLGVTSLGDTIATFVWASGINSTNNEVWWGPTGFFQGTGTTIGTKMMTTADSLTVDTLLDGTCYDFYVRSVCGPNDSTGWIGPFTFCTFCKTFTAPFFEDFDGPSWTASGGNAGNTINQCWSSIPDVSDGTEPFKWIPRSTGPTSGNGPLTDNTGGNFMYCEASGSAAGDTAVLDLPPIDLSTLNNPGLFFDQHRFGAGNMADLDVEISINGGNTFVNLYSVTGQIQTSAAAPWVTQFIDLSTYNTNVVLIRFKQSGNGCCSDAAIDNIIVNSVVAEDIEILAGSFDRQDPCLTSNDTLKVSFINKLGGTVNFATDPLTINYDVTGPVNTNSSVTVNTGTLALGDTLEVLATNIDLSLPGMYTFDAYLDTNAFNLDPFNDTLLMAAMIDVKAPLEATPDTITFINNTTDTVNMEAKLLFGANTFFITEVCHFKTTNGSPTGGWPSYLTADDYIEITGPPGADLGGITFEQWSTTSLNGTITFPNGTLLSPQGTAIIMTGQGATASSPANFLYDGRGTGTTTYGSGTAAGRILKDAQGNIIDAVGYNTYTFPAAAGVTAQDWSGNTPTGSGTAGNRLEGADLNSATNWVNSGTSTQKQNPNALNQNVVLPTPPSLAGFTWTLNGNVIDTLTSITVGPYTASGIYNYVAEYNGQCGLLTDTVVVVVNIGGCVPPANLAMSNITCDEADLSWTSDAGTLLSFVRYDTTGFNPATGGTLLLNPSSPVTLTGLIPGTTYDVWVADSCSTGVGATMTTFTTPTGPLPTIAVSYSQTTTTLSSAVVSFDATGTTDGDTYTWDFGGGSMANGITSSFTYAANGTFPVTLTVTNGCGSVDTTFNVVVQGISIEETPLGQSLNVFPNPNDGIFNVSFNLEAIERVELRVLNPAGQVILSKDLGKVDAFDGSIDLSSKAKGMYILQIETSSGTVNRRVTIQ